MAAAANASPRSQSQPALRPRSDSSNAAFLFQFFAARFEHLIVGRFLAPIVNQVFTESFFFVGVRPRCAVSLCAGDHVPFLGHLRVFVGFLWRIIIS